MWVYILIVIIAIGSGFAIEQRRKRMLKKDEDHLLSLGIDQKRFIKGGHYLGGLTQITKGYWTINFYPTQNGFDIYATESPYVNRNIKTYQTNKIGSINDNEIIDIKVEDKSTSEHRFSVGNIAMFGSLGLAMRKKKNTDLATLIIKVAEGRFESDALFTFHESDSKSIGKCFQQASESRAKLIGHLKEIKS